MKLNNLRFATLNILMLTGKAETLVRATIT